ncbi:hypothetical protein MTP99_013790 [Tenebrio molitor]|nr:hypothetical protein MTP99_013790 [Tenebrio molitor]
MGTKTAKRTKQDKPKNQTPAHRPNKKHETSSRRRAPAPMNHPGEIALYDHGGLHSPPVPHNQNGQNNPQDATSLPRETRTAPPHSRTWGAERLARQTGRKRQA